MLRKVTEKTTIMKLKGKQGSEAHGGIVAARQAERERRLERSYRAADRKTLV